MDANEAKCPESHDLVGMCDLCLGFVLLFGISES